MKKLFYPLLISFSLVSEPSKSQFLMPQLQSGVYVDTVVASFVYAFPGHCDSLGIYDVIFSVDASLIPIVSGVEIHGIVTSVSPIDSVSTLQTGTIHIGDTLYFTSPTNNYYTIFSTTSGGIFIQIFIAGTPLVPFKNYPCELNIICTLADCGNICALIGYSSVPCTVDNFSGIIETVPVSNFTLTPNPASDYFEIFSPFDLAAESTFVLSNTQGHEVAKAKLPSTFKSKRFNTTKLSSGLYFWQITNKIGLMQTGKILITNTK